MWFRTISRVVPVMLALACTCTVVGSTPPTPPVKSTPAVTQVHAPDPSAAPALLPVASAPTARPAPPKYVATLGSEGATVRTIQRVVGSTVDGFYGPKTSAAVRAWQALNRFPATGSVDAPTWRTISAAAATRPKPKVVDTPTSWAALNQAIARIPGYGPGIATWAVTSRYGHWGTTDLANGHIYISPNVPANKLYSVAAHEYAHALASANYGRNWRAMDAGINRWFGGGGLAARERATDCMAIVQGASWTHYSSCRNAQWLAGARTLLSGKRLP
jgi:hypothetical protein